MNKMNDLTRATAEILKSSPAFMKYAKKEDKALELVKKVCSKPGLMGFDCGDLRKLLGKKEFNYIEIQKNEITKNLPLIHSYKSFLFYVIGGPELTLAEVHEIEEKITLNNSKVTCMTQADIDKKRKSTKIMILMAR